MKSLDKKYYKISEVSEMLDVPASTLRFWESEFKFLRPKRNDKGTRFYTPNDIEILRKIHYLVKIKGMKIDAARTELNKNRSNVDKRYEVIERLENIQETLKKLQSAINSLK